jgi:hypothetical protein
MDANSVALGISSTHGEDTFKGKNNAPVSLTVRRTSDRTSTLPNSCAATGGGGLLACESVRPAGALDAWEAYLRHLTNVELLRLESGHFAVEDSLDVIAENMVRFYGVRVASRRALRTA